MKKLMFIAAIIAVGLVQAASLDWAISPKSFLMPDDSKPNGVTVYLFDTGAEGYSAFASKLASGELGDSISASTLTGGAGYLGQGTTYSSTKAAQLNLNYGKANGTVSVSNVGETYNLAMIVLDGSKYLISDTTAGVSYADNPDDGSAAGFSAAKMTAGSWATYTPAGGDSPEPTSAMLLLVGAGMLALRRKQK